MRKFRKIERGKDKQSVEVNQPIRRFEIPGYRQLVNLLGWIVLKLNRPLILPENILTWRTDKDGYTEINTTIATNYWLGIKYNTEHCRGELARMEPNPHSDVEVDVWVFNAGDDGYYRVSGYFELQFEDQDSADYYGLTHFIIRLAINWKPLIRIFGKTNMTYRSFPFARLWGNINDASDIVYLKKGDKLSFFANITGSWTPELKAFNIISRCAINFLGKKGRIINTEVTEWASV